MVREFVAYSSMIHRILLPTFAPISWKPPDKNRFKLNIDGSTFGNPGKAGAGAIIRDYQGNRVIGFYRHIPCASGVKAELWALKDGLQLARPLN